jgi:streptogramin lyase
VTRSRDFPPPRDALLSLHPGTQIEGWNRRESENVRLQYVSVLFLLVLTIGCADPVQPTRTSTTATQTPTSTTPATTTTTGTITTSNLVEPGSDGANYGGRQPITGAHIYLFAANTQDWGYPSIPLLKASAPGVSIDINGTYVTTNSQGNFSLTGAYTCTPGQQVYVYGAGGNPGIAPGQINSAIGMLAIFGTCPSDGTFAGHISSFVINEVTTAAAVYALSGFMTDATHVSSGPSANAQTGLANAFATVQNLIDLGTGTARQGNDDGNGFSPQAKLNTLADMVAPCINSSGVGVGCTNLFANAKVGTTTPTNTVAAMLNIAQHPAQNIAPLFALAPANSPYQPMLSAAPNDWTLAITFFSDNMPGPYYPAFDSQGNLWVPGYAYNGLTKFSPLGNVLQNYTGGGLQQPFAVAIDARDNPWVVNFAPVGASTVSVFRNNGTPITSTPYPCATACFFPAFDTTGNLWVSGTSSTTVLSPSGSQTSSLWTDAFSSGLAVDSANRTWTLGANGAIYRLALSGTRPQLDEPLTGQSGNELTPVAIDSSDNIWFASSKTSVLGKLDPNGALLSPQKGFPGGGLSGPAGIAIDGANRIWVTNRDGNSLSAFTSAGVALSPANGYRADNVSGPRGIAIDASGNVWIANFTYNSVTEFVGAATPAATPITPTNHGRRP